MPRFLLRRCATQADPLAFFTIVDLAVLAVNQPALQRPTVRKSGVVFQRGCDHVPALAQRVESAERKVCVIRSNTHLLQMLIAAIGRPAMSGVRGTIEMAEREGFEPSIQLETVWRFSKALPSATRPPLQHRRYARHGREPQAADWR
jgi:hypothetical protein